MTLAEQISLIDEMIRENPDYTIRDFLDLMADIQSVASSMEIKSWPIPSENGSFIFHQSITANDYYRKAHTSLRFYSR
jgi:hypothetical protein